MSIDNDTFAAIRQAGQALDHARSALQRASQQQSARVAEALSADPFGVENDAHFENWKAVARMAQAVQSMEEQMKAIFHNAGAMVFERPAPAARNPLRLAAADDVVEAAPRKVRRAPASAGPALRGNAARVMDYLAARLDRRGYQRVTHAEIVTGAGIPKGSVGAALAALNRQGRLREGERGNYRLA